MQEFPVTPAGYARLLGWLGGFGTVVLVGIEGTGSYGAGLARHVTAAGIPVVEAGRSGRADSVISIFWWPGSAAMASSRRSTSARTFQTAVRAGWSASVATRRTR